MDTFDTQEAIDRTMGDPGHFAAMGGIQLRSYQSEVALQVYNSVKYARGLSFVVMFPRQSGKNELQAQLEAYFLLRYCRLGGEMVKISPTWKPQSQNALRRLERVLRSTRSCPANGPGSRAIFFGLALPVRYFFPVRRKRILWVLRHHCCCR